MTGTGLLNEVFIKHWKVEERDTIGLIAYLLRHLHPVWEQHDSALIDSNSKLTGTRHHEFLKYLLTHHATFPSSNRSNCFYTVFRISSSSTMSSSTSTHFSFPQTRNVRDDLILVLHSESNIKISSSYSWGCLALIAYLLLTDDIIEHLLLLLRKPQLDRWDLLRRCYALDWKIVKNNFRTTIFVICSVYYYSSRPWCWITIQASQCYAAFSRSRCEAFNDEWNHP